MDDASSPGWVDQLPAGTSTPGPRLPLPAGELPEVRQLVTAGWELAPDAPVWVFLPALWPAAHRCWVADRSTPTMVETVDGRSTVLPWTDEVRAEHEADLRDLCEAAGVPGWAPGRIWLLRGPRGRPVQAVVDAVVTSAEAAGVPVTAGPALVAHVGRVLAEVFGAEAPDRDGPGRDLPG